MGDRGGIVTSRPASGELFFTSDGARALVGGWRGYTAQWCISLTDGSDLWQRTAGPAPEALPVVTDYGIVVVRPSSGQLAIVDPSTGKVARLLPFPREVSSTDSVDDAVITTDGRSLFCCEGRGILGLDLGEDSGWTMIGSLPGLIVPTAPTLTEGVLVAHDVAGHVSAITVG